jgi:hypothetical protein
MASFLELLCQFETQEDVGISRKIRMSASARFFFVAAVVYFLLGVLALSFVGTLVCKRDSLNLVGQTKTFLRCRGLFG